MGEGFLAPEALGEPRRAVAEGLVLRDGGPLSDRAVPLEGETPDADGPQGGAQGRVLICHARTSGSSRRPGDRPRHRRCRSPRLGFYGSGRRARPLVDGSTRGPSRRPRPHDLPQDGELADVVSGVIGHDTDLAQDRVTGRAGDHREEVRGRIGDEIVERTPVRRERGERRGEVVRRRGCIGRRPVALRPARARRTPGCGCSRGCPTGQSGRARAAATACTGRSVDGRSAHSQGSRRPPRPAACGHLRPRATAAARRAAGRCPSPETSFTSTQGERPATAEPPRRPGRLASTSWSLELVPQPSRARRQAGASLADVAASDPSNPR